MSEAAEIFGVSHRTMRRRIDKVAGAFKVENRYGVDEWLIPPEALASAANAEGWSLDLDAMATIEGRRLDEEVDGVPRLARASEGQSEGQDGDVAHTAKASDGQTTLSVMADGGQLDALTSIVANLREDVRAANLRAEEAVGDSRALEARLEAAQQTIKDRDAALQQARSDLEESNKARSRKDDELGEVRNDLSKAHEERDGEKVGRLAALKALEGKENDLAVLGESVESLRSEQKQEAQWALANDTWVMKRRRRKRLKESAKTPIAAADPTSVETDTDSDPA